MSLSEAERDALEQLQEAIENGDLSFLRKLLNQTDLTTQWFFKEPLRQITPLLDRKIGCCFT